MKTFALFICMYCMLTTPPKVDHILIKSIGESDKSLEDINIYVSGTLSKHGFYDYFVSKKDFDALANIVAKYPHYSKGPSIKRGSFLIAIYESRDSTYHFVDGKKNVKCIFRKIISYVHKNDNYKQLTFALKNNFRQLEFTPLPGSSLKN